MSNELENDPFGEMEEDDGAASAGSPTGQRAGVFGKWFVLYPLCVAVLCGAVYLGVKLQTWMSPTIHVTLDTEPDDVTVLEAGKELEPAEDGTYLLSPGKHELTFRKEGYKERVEEYDVSAGQRRFEVKLDKLAGTLVAIEIVPPDAELRVDGIPRDSNDGRAEFRVSDDEPLLLQASHPDYRAFRKSYSSEQLESADYQLRIELAPLESMPGLPASLMPAEGAEIDPEWKLPTRVVVESPGGDATLELVLMKPGEFEAGVITTDLYPGERAPRQVRIERPFYIATTETTNEQYAEFAAARGSEQAGTYWKDLWDEQQGAERLPVVGVSVKQAEACCEWLGGRLPTEDEWEFAARGPDGEGVERPWGKDPLDASRANLFFSDDARPVPVDSLPDGSTPSGLMHMLGNVAEWCSDVYRGGFGEDDSAPEYAGKNTVRGCSFMKSPDEEARLTWRAPEGPEGTPDVGFRVVFDVGPEAGK